MKYRLCRHYLYHRLFCRLIDLTLNIGAGTGIDVAADAISVDVSDFMSNGVNNRILTATGADAMNAEANLTWNGSDYFNITSADGAEGGIKLLKSSTDATHTAYHISHRDDNQSLIIYSYDGTTFRNWITLDVVECIKLLPLS